MNVNNYITHPQNILPANAISNGCYYYSYPPVGYPIYPYPYQSNFCPIRPNLQPNPPPNPQLNPQPNPQPSLRLSLPLNSEPNIQPHSQMENKSDNQNNLAEVKTQSNASPKKKDSKKVTKMDYFMNKDFLKLVFEKLSTQELLQLRLVCRLWNTISQENLHKISHLKVIPPSLVAHQSWACAHLPTKMPCSKEKYFCVTLKAFSESNLNHSYFDQINAIMLNLKDNQITTLDIYGCPRLGAALAFLLSQFAKTLQCLSLDKVSCLFDYSFKAWSQINSLSALKKLALVQIDYIPQDLPILGQLDEFHLATSKLGLNPNLLIKLLLQLGKNIRKLSLNLDFPIECLVTWQEKKPSVVANITHLELYIKLPIFHFDFIGMHFVSLTHLVLLLGDNKAIYLDIFKHLFQLSRLHYLQLVEDSNSPINCLITALKNISSEMFPLESLRELHLEISLLDYRDVSCLKPVFPKIEEIAFKYLSADSYCICSDDGGEFLALTKCETCCGNLKKILFSEFGNLRVVYGVEPDSFYEEKYGKEDLHKCRYQWL